MSPKQNRLPVDKSQVVLIMGPRDGVRGSTLVLKRPTLNWHHLATLPKNPVEKWYLCPWYIKVFGTKSDTTMVSIDFGVSFGNARGAAPKGVVTPALEI